MMFATMHLQGQRQGDLSCLEHGTPGYKKQPCSYGHKDLYQGLQLWLQQLPQHIFQGTLFVSSNTSTLFTEARGQVLDLLASRWP